MLTVHMRNHDEIQWQVGEGVDIAAVDIARNVMFIRADGDELEHVLDKFGVAALCPKDCMVVKWFGDTARFIIGNL